MEAPIVGSATPADRLIDAAVTPSLEVGGDVGGGGGGAFSSSPVPLRAEHSENENKRV